ncbi:hypothetical protein Tco_1059663 [Tanacetum coccineum]
MRKRPVPVSRPSYRIRVVASDPGLTSSPLCLLSIWLDQGPSVMVWPRPKSLFYLLYVIKSPQSSMFIACGIVLHAVPLLESTEGRVIPLAGGNKQGGQNYNVEVVGPHELNEEGSGAEVGDQTKECDHVVQDEEVNIVADKDVQPAIADKPKRIRKKRKAASGASGSNHPP